MLRRETVQRHHCNDAHWSPPAPCRSSLPFHLPGQVPCNQSCRHNGMQEGCCENVDCLWRVVLSLEVGHKTNNPSQILSPCLRIEGQIMVKYSLSLQSSFYGRLLSLLDSFLCSISVSHFVFLHRTCSPLIPFSNVFPLDINAKCTSVNSSRLSNVRVG